MELSQRLIQAPARLGDIKVLLKNDGYFIKKNDELKRVQNHDVDRLIRNLKTKQLKNFLDNGYISVSQYSNGDYKLDAHGRLRGGGPWAGWIGYHATKIAGYGLVSAGVSAVVKLALGNVAAATGVKAVTAGSKVVTSTVKGLFVVKDAGVGGLVETVATEATKKIVEDVVAEKVIEEGAKATLFTMFGPAISWIPFVIEGTAAMVGAGLTAIPFLP